MNGRKNHLFLLSALCLLSGLLAAQPLRPLRVGEKMPDVYLAQLLHHSKKSGHVMTEFGGKPLLIDFWNTHCAPCIAAMPVLDSIQKEFGGQINILLSDKFLWDSAGYATQFLRDNKYVNRVTLPVSLQDSAMNMLFPGNPYRVWIDKSGIIRYISEAEATRSLVKAFIAEQPLHLPLYKNITDPNLISDSMPLIVVDHNYDKGTNGLMSSYISGYDSVIYNKVSSPAYMKNGYMKLRTVNGDIQLLYRKAYYERATPAFLPYQFIQAYRDTLKYRLTDFAIFDPATPDKNKLFCYELLLKDSSAERAYQLMQQDLDRFFGIKSHMEKRMLPCYILRKINAKDTLSTKGDFPQRYTKGNEQFFNNTRWQSLKYTISGPNSVPDFLAAHGTPIYLPYQLIDETGYGNEKKVDVVLPRIAYWMDLKGLNKSLAKYNLVVFIEPRELDVIVLQD